MPLIQITNGAITYSIPSSKGVPDGYHRVEPVEQKVMPVPIEPPITPLGSSPRRGRGKKSRGRKNGTDT